MSASINSSHTKFVARCNFCNYLQPFANHLTTFNCQCGNSEGHYYTSMANCATCGSDQHHTCSQKKDKYETKPLSESNTIFSYECPDCQEFCLLGKPCDYSECPGFTCVFCGSKAEFKDLENGTRIRVCPKGCPQASFRGPVGIRRAYITCSSRTLIHTRCGQIAVCPQCQGRAKRVFHSVPVLFKGSGFYSTDHGRGSLVGSCGAVAEEEATETEEGAGEEE